MLREVPRVFCVVLPLPSVVASVQRELLLQFEGLGGCAGKKRDVNGGKVATVVVVFVVLTRKRVGSAMPFLSEGDITAGSLLQDTDRRGRMPATSALPQPIAPTETTRRVLQRRGDRLLLLCVAKWILGSSLCLAGSMPSCFHRRAT